jgi:hypothetical protein
MQTRVWNPLAALLMACLLVGCNGYITSPEPLITVANASYPFPAIAEVEPQTLNEDHVWERSEGKARLTLVDRSYRVADPDEAAPSSDTYLFKQIKDGLFIVQASNGDEWAYGLIVHADMYYLFTFNFADQRCTSLSAAELGRFNTIIRDDDCYVSSVKDLTGLLLHLRQRFPYPTSAFTVR